MGCRALSAFMVGGNRSGSKKLRRIIESGHKYTPKKGVIIKLGLRLGVRNIVDDAGDLLLGLWNVHKVPCYLGEFIYKFVHGKLKTNANLSHYTEIDSGCTFCDINYMTIRSRLGGNGPVVLPKEDLMHLFFRCETVQSAVANLGLGGEWAPQSVLFSIGTNRAVSKNNLIRTFKVMYRIWRCRNSRVRPTRSRLIFNSY